MEIKKVRQAFDLKKIEGYNCIMLDLVEVGNGYPSLRFGMNGRSPGYGWRVTRDTSAREVKGRLTAVGSRFY